MTLLWWVLGTVFVPMFVGEFTDVCPWLARKLIHRAARRIPEPDRSRWESEFLSDLEEQPGRIWKLIWSVGVYRGAWQMRRMLGAPSTIEALRARLEAAARCCPGEPPSFPDHARRGGRARGPTPTRASGEGAGAHTGGGCPATARNPSRVERARPQRAAGHVRRGVRQIRRRQAAALATNCGVGGCPPAEPLLVW